MLRSRYRWDAWNSNLHFLGLQGLLQLSGLHFVPTEPYFCMWVKQGDNQSISLVPAEYPDLCQGSAKDSNQGVGEYRLIQSNICTCSNWSEGEELGSSDMQ